jgi:hypothetical protein
MSNKTLKNIKINEKPEICHKAGLGKQKTNYTPEQNLEKANPIWPKKSKMADIFLRQI